LKLLKPIVFKRSGGQRLGKGFSLGELKAVGLNPKQALKLGIPLDIRRKTIHEENVEKLRKFLEVKRESVGPKPEEALEKPRGRKGKTKRGEEENG
jgi:large subunit ribosomal protein L13e